MLIHVQYEEVFTATMKAVGAKVLTDFDVLDFVHIGDPSTVHIRSKVVLTKLLNSSIIGA